MFRVGCCSAWPVLLSKTVNLSRISSIVGNSNTNVEGRCSWNASPRALATTANVGEVHVEISATFASKGTVRRRVKWRISVMTDLLIVVEEVSIAASEQPTLVWRTCSIFVRFVNGFVGINNSQCSCAKRGTCQRQGRQLLHTKSVPCLHQGTMNRIVERIRGGILCNFIRYRGHAWEYCFTGNGHQF